ncbi:hypothetical protein A3C37_03695 [Candidatus Peribacteria bacterium RIFCSPHIGHO2_02_FULL_53_20]|nr:MAG: hypothetical protein A3C37_03695 [Candidatus Peribacteria bacterium RIFCSPHIGHO2_02_FULL_53_20]OGJ67150.1 MAG: hypothetical protein A3B61_02885 [Candidatus Peribacteria bacterium RIFCSPLOWO2_01_FULL_53_10]OGJ75054.1 MAG: hypothetical protein A3G69_05445 [Candidatus Peribacteria bacterium RIFCSPLOWO2_12_FULL_53_10]
MSRLLEVLGTLTVPENFGQPKLDWNGPFKMDPSWRVADFTLCPCECLVADGKFGYEIQHHDGLVGDKNGPVGHAFANALCRQADGLNNMQGLVTANLAPPVRLALVTKVITKSLNRVVQLWGDAQSGAAQAVCDCWENKWFPADADKKLVITCGVFIHPFAGLVDPGSGGKFDPKNFLDGEAMAKSKHAIYCLTYYGMVGMLFDALTGGLTPDERIERAKTARHPFLGFKFAGDA